MNHLDRSENFFIALPGLFTLKESNEIITLDFTQDTRISFLLLICLCLCICKHTYIPVCMLLEARRQPQMSPSGTLFTRSLIGLELTNWARLADW